MVLGELIMNTIELSQANCWDKDKIEYHKERFQQFKI